MFTVDPSAILSTLVKAGEVFIPKSSQKDIQIIRECLHCERAEMNVLEKTMILYNWWVGLSTDQEPALLVGRAYIHWDSYTKPTVYIEVDNVTLLVEFRNLLLTQSNWQEIRSRGFPPDIAVSSADNKPTTESESSASSETTTDLVRFASIDLSGKARVHIKSRPLNKDLGILELDMDSLDDFTSLMQEASNKHFQETGRRGLTPPEVATLLQHYFSKKIRSYLDDHYQDMINNNREIFGDAKGFVHKAVGSILDYAADASRKTGDEWQEKVATRLGISKGRLDSVRDSLQNINVTAVAKSAYARSQDFANAHIFATSRIDDTEN